MAARPPRSSRGQFTKPDEPNTPEPAGAKVTVACKLPHGLIMRLWTMEKIHEPVMGGGTRETTIARPHPEGRSIVVHGNRAPFGVIPNFELSGGFGLTHNVDKDFWDQWVHDNASLPAVKNGLIFAHEQTDQVRDRAKERASLKSGLEPLDKDNLEADPRYRGIANRRVPIEPA